MTPSPSSLNAQLSFEQLLRTHGTIQSWPAGATIQLDFSKGPRLYFLLSGRIVGMMSNDEGTEYAVEVLPAGRVVGESSFLSRENPTMRLEAATAIEMAVWDKQELERLIQDNPNLAWPIIEKLTESIVSLTRQIERLTLMDAPQKVADFLCEMTRTAHPNLGIEKDNLPYTHEEIGLLLGLSRVTVSRVLRAFEKAGLVRLEYRNVRIINRTRLEQEACFS